MQLYYYKAPQKNFGDDLNPWLFNQLLPGCFDENSNSWMSGIGTILNAYMPEAKKQIVFSSGAGQGMVPDDINSQKWEIICVRGPLSAKVLGINNDKAVTDGAILIAALDEYQPLPESERAGVIFMPHHKSSNYGRWEVACREAGVEFINPEDDFLDTLEKIRSAKLVLADAMHAAIVADTFRVPWIPIHATAHINEFKWLDWALSMETSYEPVVVPCSTLEEKIEKWFHTVLGGLYPSGKNPEVAAVSFQRLFGKGKHRSWQFNRRVRKFSTKLTCFSINILNKTKFGKDLQNSTLSNASDKLRQLAKSQGNLSNEEVYQKRLLQMQLKLHEVQEKIKNQ